MQKNIIATLQILTLLGVGLSSVQASQWQPIAKQENGRIELDKQRIARTGKGQSLAWGRLTLNSETTMDGIRFSRIEVLNRFDCTNRRFATVKRIYLQGIEPVKEERIDNPREIEVLANTVDDRLLTEVCKPRTVGEMREIAKAAEQAVARALPPEQAPARVMLADVRQLADTPEQAREKAAAHIRVSTEIMGDTAPRIGLPSKADLAARAAAEKAALIPAETPAPAPPPTSPKAAQKGAAPSVAPSPETSTATPPPATKPSPEQVFAPYRPYVRETPRPVPRRKVAPKTVLQTPTAPVVEQHPIHWGYEGEGRPGNWSNLRPDYATCATGKRQSPIDIRDGIEVQLEPIKFDYKPTFFRIIDNGHTVQINVGAGSTIQVMGRRFELQQFHFHRPSEERVNGRAYDMVAHLVHKDLDGNLAVIAVLLENGAENPFIQTLWNNLPLEVGQEISPNVAINVNDLLPQDQAYWTYMGSLTTPPCSENVLWMVFKQPQPVSQEQVAIFARLYRNNARPIQPTNNRLIKGSR